MRNILLICFAIAITPVMALSENGDTGPRTADLDFLIGRWKITAVHYDVTNPKDPGRRETGTKVCRYTLNVGDEPSYVVCENDSIYRGDDGESHEAYIEYINYNPFVEAFEKTNFFAGFPVKVIERVAYDAKTRIVEIRGRVEVSNSTDSYVEYWRFNEDFSKFEREAMINLASMPMTEYRLILSGEGVRFVE